MFDHHSSKMLCTLTSVLALTAFTACGSDDESESGAGSNTVTEQSTATSSSSSGDDAAAQYREEFQAAGEDFKDAAQASSQKVQNAGSPAARVKALGGLKDVVTDAADDFSKLDPPANVKPDNDKLVTQFRGVAREVDAVKNALKSTDPAAAQAAAQRLQQAQGDIGKTLASIESKVGP